MRRRPVLTAFPPARSIALQRWKLNWRNCAMNSTNSAKASSSVAEFDAVLIPGGGLTDAGELPLYVISRLERGLAHSAEYFIPLSAGTPHRLPPLDARGYPIYEAVRAARYLREHGVTERRMVT